MEPDNISGRIEDVHGNHTGYFFADFPLRDLFAAFALAGLATTENYLPDHAAELAYATADAMLKARDTA